MKRVPRAARLLMVFALAALAMGANPSIEQRFNKIGHGMVCTCGCTQILLECNHVGCPVSPRMIDELHQQLAGGGGDTSIYNWFAAKYGPTVLAAPIRGGFDLVAWIVPALGSVLAIGLTAWLVLRWSRKTQLATVGGVPGAGPAPMADDLRERIRRETEY